MNKIKHVFPKLIALSVFSLSSMTTMAFNEADSNKSLQVPKAVSSSSVSVDKKILMKKLAKLDYFNANFTQKIFSEKGERNR